MSEITIRTATSNFIGADTDLSKVFIGNNKFEQGVLLNADESTVEFAAGEVLGRVAATGKLVPLDSAGTDGSQYPIGVLVTPVTLLTTAEAAVTICTGGDILASAIKFLLGDTLATVVEDKTIADRIKSDNLGIRLVSVSDSTFYDN